MAYSTYHFRPRGLVGIFALTCDPSFGKNVNSSMAETVDRQQEELAANPANVAASGGSIVESKRSGSEVQSYGPADAFPRGMAFVIDQLIISMISGLDFLPPLNLLAALICTGYSLFRDV